MPPLPGECPTQDVEDVLQWNGETGFEALQCIRHKAAQSIEVSEPILILRLFESTETMLPFFNDVAQIGLCVTERSEQLFRVRILGPVLVYQTNVGLQLELRLVEALKQ
jgi:hypothetical protein